MRRQDHTHTGSPTTTPSVPSLAKKPSEARREQNRRAQRAFRERQKAKKRFPARNTTITPRLRQLALRPPLGVDLDLDLHLDQDVQVRSSDWTQSTPTQDLPQTSISIGCNSSSEQCNIDGEQGPPQARSRSTTKQAPESPSFTFPTAQTLLPAHRSLVPKRWTPREVLNLLRDGSTITLSPTLPLWPHGVTATLAACLFNASALDIDLDRVMDPGYMSPFHRPSSCLASSALPLAPSPAVDEEAMASARFAGLRALKPCFAQVMFPHHACIDLLPLPRLREGAVMMDVHVRGHMHVRAQVQGQQEASAPVRAFDAVQELKRDVYVRQGVRFRGTGELEGGERIMCDEGGGRHCGHPWEGASWAVAPWFARKWKYLMDV